MFGDNKMSEIYCVNCGNKQSIEDRFCAKCGAAFARKNATTHTSPVQSRVITQTKHPLLEVSFFGVYLEGRTYLNLLYLILLLPLGIFFFTYAVTCFSTFAGLIPIFVGIILLYFFLLSMPYLMYAQTWLSDIFVGVKSKPRKITFPKEGTTLQKASASLKNKSIYTSFLYMLIIAMPLGIITFTITITLISTAIGLMFSWVNLIIEYIIEGQVFSEAWYHVLPGGFWIFLYVVTPIFGFLLLTASLHLTNRMAIYHSKIIKSVVS